MMPNPKTFLLRATALAVLLSVLSLAAASIAAADTNYNAYGPKVSGLLSSLAAADPNTQDVLHVIVLPANSSSTGAAAAAALVSAGGQSNSSLSLGGAVPGQLTIAQLPALAADLRVGYIVPDFGLAPTDFSVTTPLGPSVDYAAADNAPPAWSQGYDGRGVGIAIIDSGVTASPDFGTRLVQVPLSGNQTQDDGFGHGSFVAGVAGGQNASGYYSGVAPGATIYSLKVAKDGQGARTSDLIDALNWTATHANSSQNIRVAVIASSELIPSSYHGSLLDAAIEHAWRAGVVVVVAAGNLGPGSQVFAPANDPFAISVGALDLDGQSPTSFSSLGMTPDGYYRPDVYAPGRHIVSLLPLGSALAAEAPLENLISPGIGMGNGTSFAAPQVAAAAAILLQKNPNLTPDQVKWLLVQSGRPTSGSAPALDISAALAYSGTVASANSGVAIGNCTLSGQTLSSTPCSAPGGAYLQFFDWTAAEVANQAVWSGATWNGSTWNGATWNGATWNGATWNGSTWNGSTWNGSTWNGSTWNASTWNGSTWNASTWNSSTWNASTWN